MMDSSKIFFSAVKQFVMIENMIFTIYEREKVLIIDNYVMIDSSKIFLFAAKQFARNLRFSLIRLKSLSIFNKTYCINI